MDTIKLTELTVRELETVKGGIRDEDSIGGKCLCNGSSAETCESGSDW